MYQALGQFDKHLEYRFIPTAEYAFNCEVVDFFNSQTMEYFQDRRMEEPSMGVLYVLKE